MGSHLVRLSTSKHWPALRRGARASFGGLSGAPEGATMNAQPWPELDYTAWKATGEALHLWLQIVGKYRLASAPWLNHSWHATFYLTPEGFSTGTIQRPEAAVEWTFDLQQHLLRGRSSARETAVEMPLGAGTVADFHRDFRALAEKLGSPVEFHGSPNEVPTPVPFAEDTVPRPYDRNAVTAFHQAVVRVDRVFNQFRTAFLGKVSPVHLFWGSFDLAVTRFSGRSAPAHPGGIPALPDEVTREAYSHEVASAGFWAGGNGIDEACFYAYAYPTPEGFGDAKVQPKEARFEASLGEFVLPYEAVRQAADPEAALLAFLDSTWEAASRLGKWPYETLECPPGRVCVPRRVPAVQEATTPAIEIRLEESDTKGRYLATFPDTQGKGEMSFSKAGAELIIVDHTEVDDSLRGRGVGAALAARLVADMRERGVKIVPLCPFFRSVAERHPEWADLLH